MPGRKGNEFADTFARKAAMKTPHNESRKAMKRIDAYFLKRRAAEKVTRQWRENFLALNKGMEVDRLGQMLVV